MIDLSLLLIAIIGGLLMVMAFFLAIIVELNRRKGIQNSSLNMKTDPLIQSPTVYYQFDFGEGHQPITLSEAIEKPELIIEHYKNLDNAIAGGYVIKADGETIFDLIDQTDMAESWIPAIHKLLKREQSVWVWAYEESNMTLTLYGDQIELFDEIACPQTRFPFHAFVREMLEASRPLKKLIPRYKAAVDRYLADPECQKDRFVNENLKELREEFDPKWVEQFDECERLLGELETRQCQIDK